MWGTDPLRDIEGHCTQGLKTGEDTRILLQTLLWNVKNTNTSFYATDIVSSLAAVQALGVSGSWPSTPR